MFLAGHATVDLLTRAYRALGRCAPGAGPIDDDAVETFRCACARAAGQGGARRLWGVALPEFIDLARVVLRARLGRRILISVETRSTRSSREERTYPMSRFRHDLRLARRSLAGNLSSTGIAIVTLALGIGLSTAVFSILDSILWQPVPYRDADRIVELASMNVARKFTFNAGFPPALVRAWRGQTDIFARVEGYDERSAVFTTDQGADMVSAVVVTPGVFALLGVPAERGRVFADGEGRTGTDRVAVVSDRFWRDALRRDPSFDTRSILLDGVAYRVIGVMPATFRFPREQTAVWTPLDVGDPPAGVLTRGVTPLARLVPGLGRDRADEMIRARGGRLAASVSAGDGPAPVQAQGSEVTATIFAFDRFVDEKTRRSLWVLAASAAFLLLVVCANVANLALARSMGRARDVAVRSALGASRGDLVREALVEHVTIAAAGCLAGVVVAQGFLEAALTVLPDAMTTTTLNAIDLDGRALMWAVAAGAISAVAFGLPAAVMASRTSVAKTLAIGSRGSSASRAARRVRSTLVVAEVTVSIVLLVGAALMTRSFVKLEMAGKGFDPSGLISLRVAFSGGYEDAAVRDRFMDDTVRQIARLPGVSAATAGTLPAPGETSMVAVGQLELADRPGDLTERLIVPMQEVPPAYFSTLRLPILEGRTFSAADVPTTVIVNSAFVRKYLPGRHSIGARFRLDQGSWQTIVGVAGDTRSLSADQGTAPILFYYPVGQAPNAYRRGLRSASIVDDRTILVRADRPAATVPLLPAAVHAVDPRVVVWKTTMVEHQYADAIARPRVVFLLMTVFAGVGLALATAGIYGVLSFLVAQRLREIGIRLAIGATPRDVGRLVFGSGLGLTAIGLAIGLAMALALARVMRTLLYEVDPSDPWSMAAVALLLAVTAAAACWRPARRAMRVDPVQLLREE